MKTIIDKYKELQGALILDGYDPDDACIKMIDLFIADEEKRAKLAEITEIKNDELLKCVHFVEDHLPILMRKNNGNFIFPYKKNRFYALAAYAVGEKLYSREKHKAEMLKMAIASLKDIDKLLPRLTTGNLSHQMRTIQGIARRNVEYIEKHLNDEQ